MGKTLLFIEAKNKSLPEAAFISTVLEKLGIDSEKYEIICTNGYTNLLNEKKAFINQMKSNTDDGGKNIVVFDADYNENGGGFQKRKEELLNGGREKGVGFDLFLWPNNEDDGDVELLMERIARKDLYPEFFDCFNDYELCIGSRKDSNGKPFYKTPNRKGKLHTYFNALPISNTRKSEFGRGEWLFDDGNIWDFGSDNLNSIIEFLSRNIQ